MTPTLYQTLLGAAFFRLPETLRTLHGAHGSTRYAGRVTVTRGRGLLSRLCGRLAGLPAAMTDAPLTVEFATGPKGEIWNRQFGVPPRASRMRSRLWHRDGQLRERLGAIQLRFVLHTHDGTIYWNVVGARVLGALPLPAALFRDVRCNERELDGYYAFEVEATLPLAGPLIRYGGWLAPESDGLPMHADAPAVEADAAV
ncbi:DUF4166 domain-containing protein [Luteimonas sp. WGS1318]|uniref:DUF4166 domain-containing protein n=1 Tax=Luteimonas sp. WGS1318 TaxID=3366815 RepID=UPI00372CF3FC